jgi:hypothetical protein
MGNGRLHGIGDGIWESALVMGALKLAVVGGEAEEV